uniref:Uncharacterized protein n=1 Tax=Arundo donax TaxID=35708 RepID=A0A0A8Y3M1_ARUDO
MFRNKKRALLSLTRRKCVKAIIAFKYKALRIHPAVACTHSCTLNFSHSCTF